MTLPVLIIIEIIFVGILVFFYWKLDKEVKKIDHEEEYILQKAKKRAQRIIEEAQDQAKITKDEIEKAGKAQLEEYKKYLKNISMTIPAGAGTEMEKDYLKSMEEDLAEYKKQRLSSLEGEIDKRIDSIALKVFGRSISLNDHSELVKEALKEALKEDVFTVK